MLKTLNAKWDAPKNPVPSICRQVTLVMATCVRSYRRLTVRHHRSHRRRRNATPYELTSEVTQLVTRVSRALSVSIKPATTTLPRASYSRTRQALYVNSILHSAYQIIREDSFELSNKLTLGILVQYSINLYDVISRWRYGCNKVGVTRLQGVKLLFAQQIGD